MCSYIYVYIAFQNLQLPEEELVLLVHFCIKGFVYEIICCLSLKR